jgi:hypothetical protein
MYYLYLYFVTNSVGTSAEVLTSECFDEDKSFLCDALSLRKQYCGMTTFT